MSREKFEAYMALYWQLNGRWPDSEAVWNAATVEQAEQLTIARQRIAELEQCLVRQSKAALSGMDSAKARGVEALRIAQQKEAALKPELIDSEREANAVLTEENEKLIEVIRQRSHRIAELEKDCDILQTNLNAALRQVALLEQSSILPKEEIMQYATRDEVNKFVEDLTRWNHRNKLE